MLGKYVREIVIFAKSKGRYLIPAILTAFLFGIGMNFAASTLVSLVSSEALPLWLSVFLFLVAAGIVPALTIEAGRSSAQQKRSTEEIAQAEAKIQAQPEKVKPAWDLARVTLEAYFNRNLGQITSIFWLSVLVMLAGFCILVWGIIQAFQAPSSVLPAVIASMAGVITEFIGATFLFIYRSTIQQAINYSKTLERINSVGMAMQILDTMPDATQPDDLKSKTKAALVVQLVSQAHELRMEEIADTPSTNGAQAKQ